MKLIIDLPEESYKYIKITSDSGWLTSPEYANAIRLTASEYADAIKNGTPLDSVRAEINGLSGFYSQVTGISEMNTVRSIISDVNNIIDNIDKESE